MVAGRGYLSHNGELELVQLALPSEVPWTR
jgi:hypothetical protein